MGAYSYPAERRPLDEMDTDRLAKIAVVVAAGMVAERTLCSGLGNESIKEHAVSDNVRQLKGIQWIAGFSDEQMEVFEWEAAGIVRSHETTIRKTATELNRRNKLTGEQVAQLMEKVTIRPVGPSRSIVLGRSPSPVFSTVTYRGLPSESSVRTR